MGNLNGTQFLGNQVKMEGSEYNEWYGYVSDGLFLTQEDVDKSPKLNNSVKVGDIKYKDISGPTVSPTELSHLSMTVYFWAVPCLTICLDSLSMLPIKAGTLD